MHETSTVRPRKCEDPIGTLVRQLKQYSFRLKGFPLVKPKLLTKIPAPFMDLDDPYLPNHPSTNLIDTLLVEDEPNVRSFYALYSSHLLLLILHLNSCTFAFFNYWLHLLYPSKANHSLVGWGLWPDVVTNDCIGYMEQFIADQTQKPKPTVPKRIIKLKWVIKKISSSKR